MPLTLVPLCRSACVLVLTVLAAVGPSRGQVPTAPTGAGTPFEERVDVDLVEVEVFVSDAHGNPIGGLQPSDFVLTVDGERRELAGFYEGTPQAELSAATVTTEAVAPVPEATPTPTAAASARERQTSIVLLLDELHMQP